MKFEGIGRTLKFIKHKVEVELPLVDKKTPKVRKEMPESVKRQIRSIAGKLSR
jgi:hypothetical protein